MATMYHSAQMLLFPTIASRELHYPLILLQSSAAQSSLPLLQKFIENSKAFTGRSLLFCLLYSPHSVGDGLGLTGENLDVFDCTRNIPGYNNPEADSRKEIRNAVRAGWQVPDRPSVQKKLIRLSSWPRSAQCHHRFGGDTNFRYWLPVRHL